MQTGRKKQILIVDDSPANIRTLANLLVADYELIIATTGPEALALAAPDRAEEAPDLILLDVIMPDMDGYEVLRRLRATPATEEVPVIFVTASTDEATLENAFMAGANDYIRKPVSRTELMARIHSALSQQELTRRIVEEEKLQGILEMAGTICHELNQPLQSLTGFAQLLSLQTPEEDPRKEYIDIIQGQVDRMAGITRKLMHITRYETVAYVENTRIVDIDKAVGGSGEGSR